MATDTRDTQGRAAASGPLREHEIRGGGGVRLHAREWGAQDGPPILFLHGWSQSELCWGGQVAGPLADRFRMVTVDLRGHGRSARPSGPGHYDDGRLWADDVAAVIEQTGLDRPVLVAWSYGGFVVADYLRHHGQDAIAGIDLAGGAVQMLPPAFDHIGADFLAIVPDACGPDLAAATRAIERLIRTCTAQPLDDAVFHAALAWNMVVPPEVRGALLQRELDNDGVLARLTLPVLVSHGRQDRIVLPSMAEHVLAVCPTATASWYDDAGHMPFAEDGPRFDRELAAFTDEARSARR